MLSVLQERGETDQINETVLLDRRKTEALNNIEKISSAWMWQGGQITLNIATEQDSKVQTMKS